jgi:hypothetical protein
MTVVPEGIAIPVDLQRFLAAVFDPQDLVLIRPIEVYTEKGRKHSRVIYKHVNHLVAKDVASDGVWTRLLSMAAREKANLFFGVCPRFGGGEKFDLAWQIRVVRTLWADLDNCTPEEALERCQTAGLSRPSIILRSGHGVHLYWLLFEPIMITDAGDSLPVLKEFIDQGEGKKKKPRHYIVDPTTKAKRYNLPDVSPQGQRIQQIIAAIASRIGGDHTQDLSRILRLPCTMNRKDERNGKPPVPCELIECEPDRRYPLSMFEAFADTAPTTQEDDAAAKIQLKKPRKLTARRFDKLTDHINECAIADDRSRADFRLCCWAIEEGVDKEEVWSHVVGVGKFAQRGRSYFDLTWKNAEVEARVKIVNKITSKTQTNRSSNGVPHSKGKSKASNPNASSPPNSEEPPDKGDGYESPDPPKIDASNIDLAEITAQAWRAIQAANAPPTLFRYGAVPSRIEKDDNGAPMLRTMTKDRMRNRFARDAYFCKIDKNNIEHPIAPPLVVVSDVLATPDPDLPVLTRIVEAPIFAPDGSLSAMPGYNASSKVYYAPAPGFTVPTVPLQPTTADINTARDLLAVELIGEFPFVGDAEKANAVAVALGPFVRDMIQGPTPLHSIEAPSPGMGKTLLAELLTLPALGKPVTAMTEAREEDEWRKRVFAKLRTAPAALLVDNVKRRLESGALASAITSFPLWEDRILGFSEIDRVPVMCVWIMTGNNPAFSSEMTRRTVRTRLDAKVDRPWLRNGFRHSDIRGWAAANRSRLVWAALTLVQAWIAAGRPEGLRVLGMFERWSKVMGGILDVVGIRGFLGNLDDFYEKSDAEGAVWRQFVASWWIDHGERAVAVAGLWPRATDAGLDLGDKSDHSKKIRLGILLSAKRDSTFSIKIGDEEGKLRIELGGSEHGANLWKLVRG